jgi:pyridoxamine 5'-phosphate oxidase
MNEAITITWVETAPEEPLALFAAWFAEAQAKEPNDPEAVALATVGADGQPSLRMVLMRDHDERGFCFYTNVESRKGVELLAHPKAALLFHWKSLGRQVRIEGPVERVSDAQADRYFASRHPQSRLGAWASAQSRPLESRDLLLARVAAQAKLFGDGPITRPPYWSGFRIMHQRIEFWQNGVHRLHDRVVYSRDGTLWRRQRLNP